MAGSTLKIHCEVGAGETQAHLDVDLDETINEKHIGCIMAEIARTAALAIVRARNQPDHNAPLLYGMISDSYQKNMSVGIIQASGPLVPKEK